MDLVGSLGEATANLALIGVLCFFSSQYVFGKQ